MTDGDRVLWKQAQEDYTHALLVAFKALHHDELDSIEVSDTVIQAGAATVLIHITKLREASQRNAPTAHAPKPSNAAPKTPVPQCPNCNGDMWDNRGRKKNPKAPDFKCKDKNCVDDKGYNTGLWEKDLAKVGQAAAIRNTVDSYAQPPQALAKAIAGEVDDDLPF